MTEQRTIMFAGSPLNRLSWLRTSHTFLNATIVSPKSRWILFKSGNPLTTKTPDSEGKGKPQSQIAYLTTSNVRPFIGEPPYFGQGKVSGLLTPEEQVTATEAVRHRGSPIVFLGLHENENGNREREGSGGALPSSDFIDADKAVAKLDGTPYFAMDIADMDLDLDVMDVMDRDEPGVGIIDKVLEECAAENGIESKLEWLDARSVMTNASLFDGSIFAEGRSMVDWNLRNKFCPGCGSKQHSLWGGWKLGCSTLMPWADNTGRTKPCPSGKGLHNFTHPRSDPVVIMLAVDETGEKILLGQNNRFKGQFYSALAGFIEPGETFEDAVKREMWEEAGVKAWDVQYHSGQPWPFPASLMCGFYARADSTKPVRIDLDNELADARWFTRAEVMSVLTHATGSYLDLAKLAESSQQLNKDANEPPFRVPPTTAIAGVLIKDWAEGKVRFPVFEVGKEGTGVRGNL
ncbi:NUDIX hydrolase domain-like protein [Lentinula raphanica]|nr:NUDIX hydrolase domain-like protein [Lentinula raphanica]